MKLINSRAIIRWKTINNDTTPFLRYAGEGKKWSRHFVGRARDSFLGGASSNFPRGRREEPLFREGDASNGERSRVQNPDRYSGIIAARTMRCYQSLSGKPTLIRERIFAARRPRLDVFLSACDREWRWRADLPKTYWRWRIHAYTRINIYIYMYTHTYTRG